MFSPYFMPHIGGVEKHVYKVSLELLKRGHSVTIHTIQHDTSLPYYDTVENIDIFRIPFKESQAISNIWYWLMKNFLCFMKEADLIHCRDSFMWYLPFRFLFPRKSVYVTFHGYESFPLRKEAIISRNIAEILTHGNICVGHYISKWYGTKASSIIYGGVDCLPLPSPKKVLYDAVFVGRLEKDTGIETYLEAVNILKYQFGIDFKLAICGDGSLRNMLEQFSFQNELDVSFIGFTNNPQSFISNATFAFVNGYLSILEAMINEKIVISIYDNSLKEDYLKMIPDSSNKIFAINSAEELVNNLIMLINNPKLKDEKFLIHCVRRKNEPGKIL
jgi:glycosyltransferase involved in cell wall biosynthesis